MSEVTDIVLTLRLDIISYKRIIISCSHLKGNSARYSRVACNYMYLVQVPLMHQFCRSTIDTGMTCGTRIDISSRYEDQHNAVQAANAKSLWAVLNFQVTRDPCNTET